MRKTPLLPTPPVPARQFYNRNNYNQHISGPSPPRYSAYSAFSRPATLNNYRYYLQPHIPGPYTAFPPYLHQEFLHKTIPTDTTTTTSSIYRTISTDVRTLSTTSILFTSHTTAPSTTLHLMKKEDENTVYL